MCCHFATSAFLKRRRFVIFYVKRYIFRLVFCCLYRRNFLRLRQSVGDTANEKLYWISSWSGAVRGKIWWREHEYVLMCLRFTKIRFNAIFLHFVTAASMCFVYLTHSLRLPPSYSSPNFSQTYNIPNNTKQIKNVGNVVLICHTFYTVIFNNITITLLLDTNPSRIIFLLLKIDLILFVGNVGEFGIKIYYTRLGDNVLMGSY